MLEASGFVLLDEKVANPRKAIATDGDEKEAKNRGSRQEIQEQEDGEAGANVVQPPVNDIRVLAQVEGVEFTKVPELS